LVPILLVDTFLFENTFRFWTNNFIRTKKIQ